jgi:hypothetical protein
LVFLLDYFLWLGRSRPWRAGPKGAGAKKAVLAKGTSMSTEAIVLIVVLVLVFGGGGYYWRRRG